MALQIVISFGMKVGVKKISQEQKLLGITLTKGISYVMVYHIIIESI